MVTAGGNTIVYNDRDNHMSLDRILDSIHRFESMQYLEGFIIENLTNAKKEIEEYQIKLERIDYYVCN